MSVNSGDWKFVVWERNNKTGKWVPFSAEISQFLETSYKKKLNTVSLGDIDEALKIYTVDLEDMIQVSEKTGTKSKVRRHLCSTIDSLLNGFTWQWSGNDKDNWHSYDIDVNNYIENAFQKGMKSVALKKTFRGYNYEIDLAKMLQINKQTKRKRSIRRQQNVSPYPVEQCLDSSPNTEPEPDQVAVEYAYLAQEVPGTSALVDQLNSYVRSVTMDIVPSVMASESPGLPQPPERKKKKKRNSTEVSVDNNAVVTGNLSVNTTLLPPTTHAIVNGAPWYHASPPHTPSSLIKPVPGIEPLPKINKRAAKKKKASHKDDVNIFELHANEVPLELLNKNPVEEVCIICCEGLSKESSYNKNDPTIVKLNLCFHMFHKACLEAMYNSGPKDGSLQCPSCKKIYGEKCGIQPPGEMVYHVLPYSLPSFPECDTIRIIYNISSGIQGPEHPRPGKKYTARGFPRHCYLPDNEIGRKVLRLLVKAWKRRLIFTIGRSSTTGEEDTVTWNEIHHKTEFGCNRRSHGYPDPNYFDNVIAELEAHGVKDEEVYLWYPA
ncbi:E3 ubiquitin-protein ligase DTX4 [Parasteatoda tepidariorum]|uniref:E3 ubiquitin-protein ligase DTX4 n=1 Tax=Parasteatoda tepidariorum TaxID=114398 RepID=UPI0039BCE2C9